MAMTAGMTRSLNAKRLSDAIVTLGVLVNMLLGVYLCLHYATDSFAARTASDNETSK